MNTNSVVEILVLLLLAASLIAIAAERLRIPYTVALVLGGLALGSLHLPTSAALPQGQRPQWLTPNLILMVFLPTLLFEGSLKIQVRHLRENLVPISALSTAGVLISCFTTGYAVHWASGLPVWIALLFGSIVAATDPVSVLAIFKNMAVVKRLSLIVEAESLFNDGTAAVLFAVLLAGITTHTLTVGTAIRNFLLVALGGAAVGLLMGYLFAKITQAIDTAQVEITLTTILAYASYLAADALHLSGVMATVAAGLMMGNFGIQAGMSSRTRVALWSFWEYASFVTNSLVFLLIGLEIRPAALFHAWPAIAVAIAAVLLGRILSVYSLAALGNLFSQRIPLQWQHLLVWAGMRGALALALGLSLESNFPYRQQILTMTFALVAFTIVVQGLTTKPLVRRLGLASRVDSEHDRARVRQISISSAREELENLLKVQAVSWPMYEKLCHDLDTRLEEARRELAQTYSEERAVQELETARSRLLAAERSSIQQAVHDGLISQEAAGELMEAAEDWLNEVAARDRKQAAADSG
jgi:monovalent cation:H+ antiporter, CPA1 family